MIRIILISLFLFCTNAEANRIDVVGGGGGGSVSDTIYGAGWDGDTTVAPSKNAVYDKIETIASGGDNVTVNTTAATNANFLDNLYIDWAIDTAATPDDITSKFNYAETLAGNPALLTTECIYMADGIMCEGTTADTIEIKLAFPDPATTDKTITLPNATDTLVGKDTTDTLTNKTMAAASNVLDADTAVALAADPADCATATHFAVGVIASGVATCEAIADADVPDTITIDNATTAATANAGDSATAFFSSGTLEVAIGGTGTTTSTGTGSVVLNTAPTIATSLTGSYLTASEILITDGSKNIVSAAVATYPSLTELTYVKGVTSAIQTQLNTKDAVTTAGRSLTRTTNDFAADAELFTDTKCIYWENPVAADDFKSIWYSVLPVTLTKIWAESDQTVTFMLQVDDGSPADVDSVDLAPAAGTATDTSLDGDATMATGDRLDMAVTSVANTPTWVSVCWEFTKDD